MKVTAFIGSARRRHSYHAAERFLQNLQSFGNIECEIVPLSDYHLEICRGCRVCIDKGSEFCPMKDDRDKLIEKIMESDGVVFASPNYSFQVSGLMKVFLDRLGFMFHRPRFFGKTFTSIVVQGIYGGSNILKYFSFIGNGLGFKIVKGSCLLTLEPVPEERRKINDKILDKHSKRFYSRLMGEAYPQPSFINLSLFRMARSSMKVLLDETSRDYSYYKNNGWFESEYYYPVRLSPLKHLTGKILDGRITHVARLKGKVGIF